MAQHTIERLSRDEMTALQVDRLKKTVTHAYDNVDFYRRQFEEHGIAPGGINSLDELFRMPFTQKVDLVAN